MAAIGSLIFCTACGDLLPPTTGDPSRIFICAICGTQNKDIRFEPVITTSKPDAFPSALRNKHSNVQQLSEDDVQKEAVIEQACEKCGNPEMRYYTLQLRSADEGTTVFYRCPKCNYSYNTNN